LDSSLLHSAILFLLFLAKKLYLFKAFSSSILASFSCYDKAYVQPLLLIAKSIASNIAAEAET